MKPLTKREDEVLRLYQRGLTGPEIGEELGIHEKTVAHHAARARMRTGSRTTTEAACRLARQLEREELAAAVLAHADDWDTTYTGEHGISVDRLLAYLGVER